MYIYIHIRPIFLGLRFREYPNKIIHNGEKYDTNVPPCIGSGLCKAGWWLSHPSENISSSVGKMKFPIYGKGISQQNI